MNVPIPVGKPADFHHLTARFKIPLAPVFLTKPRRSRRIEVEDEINSFDPNPSIKEEKKPSLPSTTAPDRLTPSGALEAVNQSLASMLMKYIPPLGSVLVSYIEPPVFLFKDQDGRQIRKTANGKHSLPLLTIPGSGWGVIDVEVKLVGWRPTIGQKLIGRPTLSSPSHLSLVIYSTFNASIPETHLKSAGYYYDLNIEAPTAWKPVLCEDRKPDKSSLEKDLPDEQKERGFWVAPDGKIVGGDDGLVSFTVVSLTIANQMISVIGSLRDDPFSIGTSGRQTNRTT